MSTLCLDLFVFGWLASLCDIWNTVRMVGHMGIESVLAAG